MERNFQVLLGGKEGVTRRRLHEAYMSYLLSRAKSKEDSFSEENLSNLLQAQKIYYRRQVSAINAQLSEINPSSTEAQQLRDEKRRDRDLLEKLQERHKRAKQLADKSMKDFELETESFKNTVYGLVNLAAGWRDEAYIEIIDVSGSVEVCYGNFTGDITEPNPEDFDGSCTLFSTGELKWERTPKTPPPRLLQSMR